MALKVRWIYQSDITDVLEIDREVNSYYDEDFQRKFFLPWTLSEADLEGLIGQCEDGDRGIHASRVLVVEDTAVEGVAAAFAYEIFPTSREINWVALNPLYATAPLISAIARHMVNGAEGSATKRLVNVYLRDHRSVNLAEQIPAWVAEGFTCSLARDYFGEMDGWRLAYQASLRLPNSSDGSELVG